MFLFWNINVSDKTITIKYPKILYYYGFDRNYYEKIS